MNVEHFVITSGEDRTLNLTAKDRDQAVFDLTGAALKFYLIDFRTNRRVLDKDGTITAAASGTWSVSLTDADTDDLDGRYRWQGFATISGDTTAIGRGNVNIRDDGLTTLTDYGR